MSFSYDPDALDVELNRIRLELGDTDEDSPYLLDEEIAIIQGEFSSLNPRLAKCCTIIANKLSEKKVKIGDYSEDSTSIVDHFKSMAISYGHLASGSYPFSSSLTISGKEVYTADTDVVQPRFARGMHDNNQ